MKDRKKDPPHPKDSAAQKIKKRMERLKGQLARFFVKKNDTEGKQEPEEGARKENPYLPRLRMILEQVLENYGIAYREFSPLLIDTDTPPESMLDEDDVEQVLEQLSQDLNYLRIVTDRPAYFAPYIEKMYEETGLVVQIEEKGQVFVEGVNVVLDMEQKGSVSRYMREGILYIPVYKKPWRSAENLDISIPIGYNTVIVKGR